MWIKKLREAQRKKANVEEKLKRLRKDLGSETDKGKRNKIKQEIKKLENSLPSLRRLIYENSKGEIRDKKEVRRREELARQKSEAERAGLIQRDLEKRKAGVTFVSMRNDQDNNSQMICESCGIEIRNVYGNIRCGCN